ncbi:MAG: DUF1343 domain-containing protein [Verrucomicrobia bacterium]|nr:DUF1343 domain-containing protein [Verrucomicrobiota bacterium]
MDAAVHLAIAQSNLPGGVLWLERGGEVYRKTFGQRVLLPVREAMTEETIFDAASLTKVIATTTCVMKLFERGKLDLNAPAQKYLAEFKGDGKEAITLRQLLTHTSGLRPGFGSLTNWSGTTGAIKQLCAEKPAMPPGIAFRYSDLNFISLGEIVRRVSGEPLDKFAAKEIFQPLKMNDTGFLPTADKRSRIAPTELAGGEWLRGGVHDPTSRRMGGVAGHAGLFFTAADLARFARMLLNGGELDGVRILKTETVKLMTSVQTPPNLKDKRGLGWDIDTSYSKPRGEIFPNGTSFGHTGWTGTSLWVDPNSQTFLIFLSNRNHPDGKGSVTDLRHTLGTLAAEAAGVKGSEFKVQSSGLETNAASMAKKTRTPNPEPRTPNPSVLNGIDVLARKNFAPLKKLRLGLITNHTGRDRARNATIDLLHRAPDVQLKALFSPEHGIRGALDQSKIADDTDAATGLPVYSLYGETRAPRPEQLRDLDALVFDIQDIGCRFYTYVSTMGNCLEAAGKAGIKFFVLDRVNPITGVTVDGPVLAAKTSFTAFHPIPVRHGMTAGELARMFNAERGFKADLTVIPVEGWNRAQWFDETGLPWTNPSPNMRSLAEATLYPGIGLLETTAVSVGRGTDTPFEVVGAPYIHDVELAAELNRAGLPGVRFVPVQFTPTASVFKDKLCSGVNIFVTDRERFAAVDTGLVMAQTLHRLYAGKGKFEVDKFDRLLGHPPTIAAIKAGKTLVEIRALWREEQEKFRQRREKFLLY